MAFLHEEEDDHTHTDEGKSMAQRTDTRRNLKRHISLVSLYVIVAKFGGHALRHFK